MKQHNYYTYILTNQGKNMFYTGVTNNLTRRVLEHKAKLNDSYTAKYNIHRLVYFETFHQISDAIRREKQLKRYKTIFKINLIEKQNIEWKDLFFLIGGTQEMIYNTILEQCRQCSCYPGIRRDDSRTQDVTPAPVPGSPRLPSPHHLKVAMYTKALPQGHNSTKC